MSDLHEIRVLATSGRYVDLHLRCIHPDAFPPEGISFALDLLREASLFGGAEASPDVSAELERCIERDVAFEVVVAVRFLAYAEKEATYRAEVRDERFLRHMRPGLSWESAAYTKHWESNEMDLMDLPRVEQELAGRFGGHPMPALFRQCLRDRAAGKDALLRDGKSIRGQVVMHLYGPSSLEDHERRVIEVAARGLGTLVVFGRLYWSTRPHWTFGFLYGPGCSPEDPPIVGVRREDHWPEVQLVGQNLEDLLTRDLLRPIHLPPPELLQMERSLAPRWLAFLEDEQTAGSAVPVLSRHPCAELIEPLLRRVPSQGPLSNASIAAIRVLAAWREPRLIPQLEQLRRDPEATESDLEEIAYTLEALGEPGKGR